MVDNRLLRTWIPLLISVALYVFVGYFISREDTFQLLGSFAIISILFVWIAASSKGEDYNILFSASVVMRLLFIASLPTLSDDVYRFIWDGRLLNNGINPFESLPSDVVGTIPGMDSNLFAKLNSQGYYTVYPPISQFVFWLAAAISPNSILGSTVVIRGVIVMAEIGNLFLMKKLLARYGVPAKNIFLYALNPLIIIELSGNLHFEALVIFFVLLGVALIMQKRLVPAAFALGMAVGVKLIPVIFLPLFIRRMGWKKFIIFSSVVLATIVVLFFPLFSAELYQGMSESILLYFQKFEFNASIYYLFREWGYYWKGWNIIAILGPRLAIATAVLIMLYTWYETINRKLLFDAMIWVLLIYFSLATTIHPWYISTIVAFGVFTKRRWPVVWSLLIFITYIGYNDGGYSENYILLIVEYGLLAAWILFEYLKLKKKRTV